MMKSSELVLIVDSVEDAVKFYTEKLAFDLTEARVSTENAHVLSFAQLRKGKCFIMIRLPSVEELAEFSFIKRCVSRCTCLYVEMKKGIEKYYDRCKKKGVKIATELKSTPDCPTHPGCLSFSIRDPFGIKLIFSQPANEKIKLDSVDLAGLKIKRSEVAGKKTQELEDYIDRAIGHLKTFSVVRRAAKKFAKHKLKQLK